MIQARYDQKRNAVILDFSGKIDAPQAEQFYLDIQKIIPKCGKGFKLLTDLSAVQEMGQDLRNSVKKTMDLFNAKGVTKIIRVIPDPEKDIGFNIMSLFHYSKDVSFVTVPSRQEAEARL